MPSLSVSDSLPYFLNWRFSSSDILTLTVFIVIRYVRYNVRLKVYTF